MGRERDLNPIPNIKPLGMMIHLLSHQCALSHERKGFLEILKLIRTGNGIPIGNHRPMR